MQAIADPTTNAVMVYGRLENIEKVEEAVIAELEGALFDYRDFATLEVKEAVPTQLIAYIQPFLDEKLVGFVQADPEWCGGLSELLRICKLARRYKGVRVIPHGHHVLAASHVVASQPESLCPMVEYGPPWLRARQRGQTRMIAPEAGSISTPHEPGLGPSIDWNRFERS